MTGMEESPDIHFVYSRRIQFSETDMAGIVHFSHFYRFMEEAEHAFLRSRDLAVFMDHGELTISWPRLSASCDFKSPARFGDVVDIAVGIETLGRKAVTYKFDMSIGERPVAIGRMVVVCCRMHGPGHMKAVEIPPEILQRITGPGPEHGT